MGDVVITRETNGYRGEVECVEIVLPSRSIQLPGRKHFVSGFWSLVLFYLAVYAFVALGIYLAGINPITAGILLVMLLPFGLLAGGALFGWRGFRPRDFTPLRKGNPVAGKIIHRPKQLLRLSAKSIRRVYEGDSVVQETVIRLRAGLVLRSRDDDGKDDLSFDTISYSLIRVGEREEEESDEEQLLLVNVARDERGELATAIREAVQLFA